jgi:hypothetical protein
MLVCDTVITDRGTGKHSLIGIFERILAASLPVRHPLLAVYAKVTDAQGQYIFKLELVNLGNNQIIGEVTTPPVEIPDRMLPHDLIFNLHGLVFQTEGRYEFRLYADGQFVGLHTFEVRLLAQRGGTS